MKKYIYFIIIFLLFLIPNSVQAVVATATDREEEKVTIYLFYSEECPHCHNEREWLNQYLKENSSVELKLYERTKYKELTAKVRKSLSISNSYIPLTIIGSDYFIGYNKDTAKQIEEAVNAYSKVDHYCDIVSLVEEGKDTKGCRTENNGIYAESTYRILPILGEVNTREISLPIMAIVIGFVDGFNPCAMWVLIFLITMMLDMKDRKKMWILGSTFLLSSAIIYLFFMISWFSLSSALLSVWFRCLIGVISILISFFHLRKFWKNRKKPVGCEATSKKQKHKIIQKIENIVKEKSYLLAIIGMIALAFSVNIVELACSAGLPLLFTQILSINHLQPLTSFLYMLLYIFFYLIDDFVIFMIAMISLKATGISNKYTKYSSLVGGLIMLILGLLLIFKPAWIMFNF